MKIVARIAGVLFLLAGVIILLSSFSPTGLAILENTPRHSVNIAGIILIANGIILLSITRQKKGQEALEFLSTYSWAILAAIIALAIIISYTLIGSEGVTSRPPLLSPPLYAVAHSLDDATGIYSLQITSSQRGEVVISEVQIDGCTNTAITPSGVPQGGSAIIRAYCPNGVVNGKIFITYDNGIDGPSQISTGSIYLGPPNGGQGGQGGAAICGDGLTEAGETCDDGNTISGDGCSAFCATESCTHNLCTTGSSLDSSCSPCVAEVCASDSGCCESGWDSVCVEEAQNICGITCTKPECSDGIDNDNDGLVDLGDSGCAGDPNGPSEAAR